MSDLDDFGPMETAENNIEGWCPVIGDFGDCVPYIIVFRYWCCNNNVYHWPTCPLSFDVCIAISFSKFFITGSLVVRQIL